MMSPTDFLYNGKDDFLNLDSNVAYWTKAENQETKERILNEMWEGTVNMSTFSNLNTGNDMKNLEYLIGKLSKISKYAVYLDITPPEVINKGLKVMRVFIPELVQLSYPGFPYTQHPRVLENGGISVDFPHPMP